MSFPDPEILNKVWKEFAPAPAAFAMERVRKNTCNDKEDEAFLTRLSVSDQERWRDLKSRASSWRQAEWLAGRRCVAEVTKILGPASTSLAHSGECAVAVGLVSGSGVSVGVDLEKSDRLVDDNVAKRIVTVEERRLGLGAIFIWAIKEACFKAENQSLGVPWQLKIFSYDAELGVGVAGRDSARPIRFRLVQSNGWVIAFAYCEGAK
jgi:4'-phosphopantetheinyl transferase EntD